MKCKLYVIWLLCVLSLIANGCESKERKEKRSVLGQEGQNMELPKEIVGKDGAPMVLIPAGEFQMGSNDGGDDGKPMHTIYVDAFYMDKYEVTNALYKKFMDAMGRERLYNTPDHPVVSVRWQDAVAYAEWAGKRLPTEAEWEKAARGGLTGMKYPWGDEITEGNANYDFSIGSTTSVGTYPPNGYGLYDMAGNVYEWCIDWYEKSYYASSPGRNPVGPGSGTDRVLRGGSFSNGPYYLRVATRRHRIPSRPRDNDGFRCARSVTP